MSLHLVPVSFADACGFVTEHHRHLPPPGGHKFSIGVATDNGVLRGVAMIGRPVARHFDDGTTLEVRRTATDGTRHANSMLYAAAWRAAKAMGFARLVTYTMTDVESGASLRAAGWRVVAHRKPQGWNRAARPRDDRAYAGIPRTLWEAS